MRNLILHGLVLVALLFLAGSGCSDNNSDKATLAALYAQLATSTAVSTVTSVSTSDAVKLANGSSYRACVTAATTDEARVACASIPY